MNLHNQQYSGKLMKHNQPISHFPVAGLWDEYPILVFQNTVSGRLSGLKYYYNWGLMHFFVFNHLRQNDSHVIFKVHNISDYICSKMFNNLLDFQIIC